VGLGISLFTTAFRTALGPTQLPIQRVPGAISLGIKRPGREAGHSPSSAEVKECVELYLHSPNTPSWRGAQLKRIWVTTNFPTRFLLHWVCYQQSVNSIYKWNNENVGLQQGSNLWSTTHEPRTPTYELNCILLFYNELTLPKYKTDISVKLEVCNRNEDVSSARNSLFFVYWNFTTAHLATSAWRSSLDYYNRTCIYIKTVLTMNS
jgi:hypothetical protein